MENQIVKKLRVHRVGSITSGVSMVILGVLFTLYSFFRFINYQIIFKLWPFMIIGLGIEILLSNNPEQRIVYDKAAIILMFLIVFFAAGMAVADMCITHLSNNINITF